MQFQPRAQAAAALRQITLGLRASQALYVAAKLNIADHLAQGPLDADELSKVAEVDAAAVGRVMRALCSLDVFAQSPTGKFSLNSTAELLRSDVPWIHAGYQEFPPELGNESKYPYVRDY